MPPDTLLPLELLNSGEWADVAEVCGEPAQQRIDYLYTDRTPPKGANYYRLKQVDIDGRYVYTYVVVAVMGYDNEAPLLFPNPVKGSLHIAFNMPIDGPAPAVINALRHAGYDLREIPATPEKVMAAQ